MNGDLIDHWPINALSTSVPQRLPSGTLTYMLTDIEDSTHLWDQHPEQARVAMIRHDALVQSVVRQHGGWLVRPRGEGDSRFAVFPLATAALQAAMSIQRLMVTEPWMLPPLRLRIALHSGEAELRDGDYYGNAVNRCARLRSAAHGGQILISEATHCLVRDELPTGASVRDLGAYSLKGLERPEHIFQVVAPDLRTDFPALNTPDTIQTNLPLPLTSFIGREREVSALEQLLWQTRLLTVAGPGGVGKTRLVLEAGQNVKGFFPDGVWFVNLAPLTDTSLFSSYVMNVLGVREEIGYAPDQTLLDALRSKTMLLILDNCEHLLPEITVLAESILHSAPGLRILATSREKLGAAGEILWRIPSLSTPYLDETIPFEDVIQYESIRLFQDRAQAVRSDFFVTRENADAVVKICTHLDGIPLAIELAAARIRVISAEEILSRLEDRFRLLVGTPTALPRQQTLRALIDWSYDLLLQKERILLYRLSVFAGSWTLEAAEEVCSGGAIETWEVLDLLTSLIDKSFVLSETQNGYQRYRFLETMLKFCQERMLESQEAIELARKHALYFLKFAETSYGKMWGYEQASWLLRTDDEYDNLRTALAQVSNDAGSEAAMVQMAGCLWRYWEIRGYISEGRIWLKTALEMGPNEIGYWRANCLGAAGHLARQQADYQTAKTMHEKSLRMFHAIGNKLGIARQLNALGEIAQFQGDYSRAIELHKKSLACWYEINDPEGIAVSLRQLGVISRDHGQYQDAEELLGESLKLERKLGDRLLLALSLNDLGLVAYHNCQYERAVSLFEEALGFQRELSDKIDISNTLLNLGNVAKDQGDFIRAEQLYQESLVLKKNLGEKRGIARAVADLSEIAVLQGKYHLAANLASQSLALSQKLGARRVMLHSKLILGFNAYYQGNNETVVALSEESLALATEMNAPQAMGYVKVLLALVQYAEGNLAQAKEKLLEALTIFQKINDFGNIARTDVNLARITYRQGDHSTAMKYLDESVSISRKLNVRWTLGLVLEIMGLLQRHAGNFKRAFELFQESLILSIEQDNQQGIANCLGALAGLAVLADQPSRAARLFGAADKLRRVIGSKMSNSDQLEYEKYLAMVHMHLVHATFENEWSQGFTTNTGKIIEEVKSWADNFENITLAGDFSPNLEPS